MNEKTLARMPKSLLIELKKLKTVPRESYADVVRRLIAKKQAKERRLITQ
jgi:predicted CopG family antitoxin